MTEEMLVDLMTGLDVTFLENDYLERDLSGKKKSRRAFWHPLRAYRERKQQKKPLSYEMGEAIRTDLDKRFRYGVSSVKHKVSTAVGILSGVATMVVVTLGFAALLKQKRA